MTEILREILIKNGFRLTGIGYSRPDFEYLIMIDDLEKEGMFFWTGDWAGVQFNNIKTDADFKTVLNLIGY